MLHRKTFLDEASLVNRRTQIRGAGRFKEIKNITPKFCTIVTFGAGISRSPRLLTPFLKHSKREVEIFSKRRLPPPTDKISRQEIEKTEHLSFNSDTQFISSGSPFNELGTFRDARSKCI